MGEGVRTEAGGIQCGKDGKGENWDRELEFLAGEGEEVEGSLGRDRNLG